MLILECGVKQLVVDRFAWSYPSSVALGARPGHAGHPADLPGAKGSCRGVNTRYLAGVMHLFPQGTSKRLM